MFKDSEPMNEDFEAFRLVCQRNTVDTRGSQEFFQNSLKALSISNNDAYRIIKRIIERDDFPFYAQALGNIAQMYSTYEKNNKNLAPSERDAIRILAMKEDLPTELYVPAIILLIHSNELKKETALSGSATRTPEVTAKIKELTADLKVNELTLNNRLSQHESVRTKLAIADGKPLRNTIIALRSTELDFLLNLKAKTSEKKQSSSVIGRKLQMFSDHINKDKLAKKVDVFATLLHELKKPDLNDQQFKDKNKKLIILRREIANLVDPAKRSEVLAGASVRSVVKDSENRDLNRSMKSNR